MAATQHVQYNDNGTWIFALVTGQGEGGPANYDLETKKPDEGNWQHVANVPEGSGPGCWREPR